ncbi:MAG: thioredoxin fold domain-containing protein [Desulfamplus sp.]|nr:thioredoxin fold domain-containing protein [Desulfamplus sp.]
MKEYRIMKGFSIIRKSVLQKSVLQKSVLQKIAIGMILGLMVISLFIFLNFPVHSVLEVSAGAAGTDVSAGAIVSSASSGLSAGTSNASAVPAVSGGIEWKDYDKGVGIAKDHNKKVFLYFHADWCGYCRKMDASTFKDKALIDYMNANFIAIRVNSDVEKKIAESYGVRGLPTCWFLKSNSDKLSSMPGYIDAEKLLVILKYVHTESYEKMSFNDFEKSL